MIKLRNYGFVILMILSVFAPDKLTAQSPNGFDLSASTIPTDQIFSGGPPRDGIPSIDDPQFISAGDVDYLKEEDIVIGFGSGDTARAYPLRILIWHEIVNDVIDGQPIAVTYCPLCGTSMVFDARIDGQHRSFGVSGLLYQSDVLMYDRETESLWSQLKMEAVSDPAAGQNLTLLPSEHMTWKAWREKYPKGSVLSLETGHQRDYKGQAYASYFSSDRIMFPVPVTRRELANKDWVVGVVVDGQAQAYPVKQLPDGKSVRDEFAGKVFNITWDAGSRRPTIQNQDGGNIPYVMAFWFAWQAFYPETGLWKP